MRDVSQHFELIEKVVEYSSVTEAEFDILRFDATSGIIEGVVYFANGSRVQCELNQLPLASASGW